MHKSVIVDECISPRIAKYLQEMGEEVITFKPGTDDNELKRVGRETGAYIITRDKGFRDYQLAIILTRREKPKWVYEELKKAKANDSQGNL